MVLENSLTSPSTHTLGMYALFSRGFWTKIMFRCQDVPTAVPIRSSRKSVVMQLLAGLSIQQFVGGY